MLAISSLTSSNGDERGSDTIAFRPPVAADDFSIDFTEGTLLDDIDFNDLFVGFDDGDILPDLEVVPADILAKFSIGGEENPDTSSAADEIDFGEHEGKASAATAEETREEKSTSYGEEAMSIEKEGSATPAPAVSSSSSESKRSRKSSKGSNGKRKVKVDWTPELHRRFVQAVEQLGVDKAVPSRILELMGIDCLTRHNIASHLQKYRSHRKHLLAREAEAASLSQRRQMYAGGGGGAAKRDMSQTWLAPTIGFPHPPVPSFRPLHVWGHPTMDHSLVHVWPKHLVRSQPPPSWIPQPPPDPSYWHHHYPRGHQDGWMPNTLTQGTPCFSPAMPMPTMPMPMQAARFPAPPVPAVRQQPLFRPNCAVVPPPSKTSQPKLDAQPSKECIDAAIGDVMSKPWMPLPLGLKPPSVESVMVELQKQGISNIPPTCS